jgi:hypothetical protein
MRPAMEERRIDNLCPRGYRLNGSARFLFFYFFKQPKESIGGGEKLSREATNLEFVKKPQ